ncbi:MAG: hypothetical protein WBG86_08765 [Polyangiales bacterium]
MTTVFLDRTLDAAEGREPLRVCLAVDEAHLDRPIEALERKRLDLGSDLDFSFLTEET